MIQVTEFTDAMCSWAWGTEPKLRLLRWRFGDQLEWRRVMGHLVEDEYMPERDRVEGAAKLEEYWKVVCDQTGMPRPAPLNRTTAGSRASGLAATAATAQSAEVGDRVMRRLREATFVYGEPPDAGDHALAATRGVHGLDTSALAATMDDESTMAAYLADAEETRRPNEYVRTLEGDRPGIGRARDAKDGRARFVFPTIVVEGADGVEHTVPGWMPYEAYEAALGAAGVDLSAARPNPTPAEAFETWPTLSSLEFELLCGPDALLPEGIVTREWAGGTLYLTPAEAEAMNVTA